MVVRWVGLAAFVLVLVGAATPLFAAAPTATTSPASGFTTTSALLNGEGTPGGEATTGWFRYHAVNPGTCNDSFGTRVPAVATDLGAGTSPVPFSTTATGLTSGVTYYFCAIVSNASGTAYGSVLSFTVPSKPITLTTGPISVTSSSATLQGSANPVASTTQGWFRYSSTDPGTCDDSFGTRAPTASNINLGSGTSSVDYSRGVTGLLPGTTYYYCALASNAYGTSVGGLLFFTTPATAPTVTTGAATSVTSSSATLEGTGIARGDTALGFFRLSTTNPGSCNNTFGTRVPAAGGTALGSANDTVPFSEPITGLSLATTYYFCAIAVNGIGTTTGALNSFTTPSTTPTIVTTSPTSVAATSATLNGVGTPNGAATTGWFRYSTSSPGTCNDSFGTRAPTSPASDTSLGSGTSPSAYNRGITNLVPTTTYYVCAIGNNTNGTTFGSVVTFTTLAGAPSVTTSPTSILSATAATLEGSAIPNGDAATGWFRYSPSNPVSCSDSFGTRAPAGGGDALGAGTSSVPFSEGLTGLTPNTTYWFCALASNSLGTRFGSVLSFTTPASPSVTTGAATIVTGDSATLNGQAIPNHAAAIGWFRYATSDPGTCNDSFGARAPGSDGDPLGAGSSSVAFSEPITGLASNTTYYYCALSSNSEGTGTGSVLSFTTLPAPTVSTAAATLVTSSSATLNGTANPQGDPTTGWFRYGTTDPGACNDVFGTRTPFSGDDALGAGAAGVAFSEPMTGLSPATTYYYCAIASNAFGKGFGAVTAFTTSAVPPSATTNVATSVTATGAQLEGAANPLGASATGWFRYATTDPGTCNNVFGTRAPGSGGAALGSGTSSVPYAEPITGLSPNTSYYYCALASNSGGTAVGAVVSFTTKAAPTVTTGAATLVTSSSATLHGDGNPHGDTATGWFRYSATDPGTCDDSFGTRAPSSGGDSLGAGTSPTAFSEPITGLDPATTYYACAIASNAYGMRFGAVTSFTTSAVVPTVTTSAPTSVSATTAQLDGAANPRGDAATGWFRYGTTSPGSCDDDFGTRAPSGGGDALGAGNSSVPFSEPITGLAPATTYYVCAIASNSAGTAVGSVVSFTTPAAPSATTGAATSITGTTATLNGTGNPNLATTTGRFRYATSDPGTCDDTFGTAAPASGGSALGAGTTDVPYAQSIAGLAPLTTYYYCAIASSANGIGFGEVVSFTTAGAPTVTTAAPTDVADDAATLHGSAIPNGDATTGWFRYAATDPGACDDSFGTRSPSSGGTALGAGGIDVAYASALAGLSPATMYYACAIAANAAGTAFGEVVTFMTGAIAPTVTTEAATNVVGTGATIAGTANPNGSDATGWFRYGPTDPGTCSDAFGTLAPTAGIALGAETTVTPFETTLDGLDANQTYYYCAAASNLGGAVFGALFTFTTDAIVPQITTEAALVDGAAVTLEGLANPRGADTLVWFRYGPDDPGACDDAFGTRTTDAAIGDGRTEVSVSQDVTGLAPGTYFACAIASNEAGLVFGDLVTFEFDGGPDVDDPSGCCSTGAESRTPILIALAFLLIRRRRR